MRTVRRLAWAAAVAAATTSPAAAQQGGGGTTGNTGGNLGGVSIPTNLGGLGTTSLPTGGGTGTTTNTTGGTGTGGSSDTGTFTLPQLTVEAAPQIRAPSTYISAAAAGRGVQASNQLGAYYANPLFQGITVNARNATATPGGFGTPLFTSTGAAGTGARAGVTTTGRAGGTGLTTDPGGQLVQLPRQIAYTAQLKFAAPPVGAPRLQADLRGVLDRSAGMVANPAGVQVQVDGNAVVLRGAVRDDEEARLVEGLVRLTPGVGRITNELSYPRP